MKPFSLSQASLGPRDVQTLVKSCVDQQTAYLGFGHINQIRKFTEAAQEARRTGVTRALGFVSSSTGSAVVVLWNMTELDVTVISPKDAGTNVFSRVVAKTLSVMCPDLCKTRTTICHDLQRHVKEHGVWLVRIAREVLRGAPLDDAAAIEGCGFFAYYTAYKRELGNITYAEALVALSATNAAQRVLAHDPGDLLQLAIDQLYELAGIAEEILQKVQEAQFTYYVATHSMGLVGSEMRRIFSAFETAIDTDTGAENAATAAGIMHIAIDRICMCAGAYIDFLAHGNDHNTVQQFREATREGCEQMQRRLEALEKAIDIANGVQKRRGSDAGVDTDDQLAKRARY